MEQEFELIAKTFMGLEPVLAQELTQLGANNVQIGRRMVSFTGNKEMMYRANFQLHTAIRILKPIAHFKAKSAEDMYNEVKKIDWSKYIEKGKTFSVDSVVYSEEFRNSRFVTYKVKDAIVDQFRENTGTRPNISVSNPDIRLNIHVAEDDATLSLDSSGESLHRRGYRQESVEAPLNEVLAAGMILMTGWKGDTDFIDPMCGSGTLLIEAALIARNMSPGIFRKEFAFEKWPDFDQELFDKIYNDDSEEREFTHHIYGYDIDMKAVNTASLNVRAAGFSKDITVSQADFKDFKKPEEKSIMITNPPYGERISTPNLLGTYKMIGERLKHAFMGNEAWILSYREECFEQIGLKPSIKIPVYNGSLECEFRKYSIFDGKMKEFRAEGGIVKTDAEKREMAQKHRFKKNREFKKRLEAEEENEDGDIRSFTFHKPNFGKNDDFFGGKRGRRNRNDGDKKEEKSYNKKGGKRFDKGNKRGGFDKRRNRFNEDE
ncbi:THUMP domain-containing class I SAM-dependent RNA methyltransferase [Segatella albensis]|jgi:putative N6-adenine-specific DNA methylase|uniref:THUMP domain-containing class I SAM-dependent RNA methyltransferase n=1 Tax=Segatella albensis TaxID=77768 RepID=UPI00041811E0|nr:THUMP domain-containing protein [Segatella albensis]